MKKGSIVFTKPSIFSFCESVTYQYMYSKMTHSSCPSKIKCSNWVSYMARCFLQQNNATAPKGSTNENIYIYVHRIITLAEYLCGSGMVSCPATKYHIFFSVFLFVIFVQFANVCQHEIEHTTKLHVGQSDEKKLHVSCRMQNNIENQYNTNNNNKKIVNISCCCK